MYVGDRRQVAETVGSGEGEASARDETEAPRATQDGRPTGARSSESEWAEVLRGLCERFARQSGRSIGSVSLSLRVDGTPGEPLAAARLCEQIAADYGLKARAIPSSHEIVVRLTRVERHDRAA